MVKGARLGSLVLVVLFAIGATTVLTPSVASAAGTIVPQNLSPNGPSAQFAGNPTFTWTAPTAFVPVYYKIQLSASDTFTPLLNGYDINTVQTTFAPPTKLPVGTIYWRVYAYDGVSLSAPATASLTILKPDAPQPQLPADNAKLDYPAQPVTFTWSYPNVPAGLGVAHYLVWVSTVDSFINVTPYSVDGPRLTLLGNQAYNVNYYWKVAAQFSNGDVSAPSPTRAYQTRWSVGAAKPTLLTPPNAIAPAIQNIEFTWTPVMGAWRYHLEVNRASDFHGEVLLDQLVVSTRVVPNNTFNNASYYWKVTPVDVGGNAGTSSDASVFTRDWTPVPTLVSPANGAPVSDPVTLQWTPIERASYYEIAVSTDPGFSNANTCTAVQTSVSPYSGIAGGDPGGGACLNVPYEVPYYWHVRGMDTQPNGSTISGIYSATRSFTRHAVAINIVAPANGATVSQPILQWQRNVPGINYFRVKLFNKDGMEILADQTYGLSYALPLLDPTQGPYSWYVNGVGFDNNETAIPLPQNRRTFNVTAPVSGPTLTLLSPANGVQTVDLPLMQWSPVTGANRYIVYVQQGGGAPLALNTQLTGTAYTYNSTLPTGAYNWYVVAYNGNTLLQTSAVRTMTLLAPSEDVVYTGEAACWDQVPNSEPSCPGARSRSPLYSWDPVPGATYYQVTVAYDRNFTNIFKEYGSVYTAFRPQVEYADNNSGQAYYWHVRAFGRGNTISAAPPYSRTDVPAQAFQKRSLAIPSSSLVPANTIVAPSVPLSAQVQIPNPSTPTFSWPDYLQVTNSASALSPIEAVSYYIQVSLDAGFTQVIDAQVVDNHFYTPSGLNYPFDVPLYWRVRPVDQAGNVLKFSDATDSPSITTPNVIIRRLNTSNNPTAAATLASSMLTPAANESLQGDPTFTWTPRAGAAQYKLEMYWHQGPGQDVDGQGNPNMSPQNLFPGFPIVTPATEITPWGNLPPNEYYAWRIAILDGSGSPVPNQSAWSTGRRFFIAGQSLDLAAPVPGQVFRDTNEIVFGWDPVPGATSYLFQSSTTSDFAGLFEQQSTVMLAWAPFMQYPNSDNPFYWRVKALDVQGHELGTSQPRTFYVKRGRATVPQDVTVTPYPGAARISWNPPLSAGTSPITNYKVTITPTNNTDQPEQVVTGDVHSVQFNGLMNGSIYIAHVVAINGNGVGLEAQVNVQANGCAQTPFSDVQTSNQFCTDITWLYANKISTGSKDADTHIVLFKPVDAVTRLDMAAFLWRAAGKPAVAQQPAFFADVPFGSYPNTDFYPAVQWMGISGNSTGVIQGGQKLYQPSLPVSRFAMAAFLHRYGGNGPSGTTPHFADVPQDAPFFADIQWMFEKGISQGTPVPGGLPLYKPNDPVSRQAMARFLHNVSKL